MNFLASKTSLRLVRPAGRHLLAGVGARRNLNVHEYVSIREYNGYTVSLILFYLYYLFIRFRWILCAHSVFQCLKVVWQQV